MAETLLFISRDMKMGLVSEDTPGSGSINPNIVTVPLQIQIY